MRPMAQILYILMRNQKTPMRTIDHLAWEAYVLYSSYLDRKIITIWLMRLVAHILYLREFVYYRHPGPPVRVNGGSEQQFLPPLPGDPRIQRIPGIVEDEFQTARKACNL